MLTGLPESWVIWQWCYFYVCIPSTPITSGSHTSWYVCPRTSGSTDMRVLCWRLTEKRGSKPGGAGITPFSDTSSGTFTGLAWWPADPNCWVTQLCFGLFVKQETIFEGKSQWGDMAAPVQGPPGTTKSLQNSAHLCVAWGSRKPTQPRARISSLLQYFLSIHFSHLGKGWITI